MKLTQENYYSQEANLEYMGSTQFKDFQKCEKEALAKVKGEYVEPKSDAMLMGSYIDAYFSGELESFIAKTPELLDTRKKEPTIRQAFVNSCNEIISAIENDTMMMEYLNGEHQVIMTGEIKGVKFKIKIDSLLKNAIVDQKIMSSISDLIWVEENGKNVKVDFVQAYGYDIQGAIYQEIVRQNIGHRLPFILAVATKEQGVDKALIEIDQYWLDKALKFVESKCERYDMIKKGLLYPVGCGRCPTCRKTKQCHEILSYEKLYNKVREEENETE